VIAFLVVATAGLTLTSETVITLPWLTNGIIAAGLGLILTRVGLLATTVSLFTNYFILLSPITSNPNAWYADAAGFAITVLVGLIGLGLYLSLTGRNIRRQAAPGL
jgi:hypothetical protein